MANAKKKFVGEPRSVGPGGAWTFMAVPLDVEKTWGTRARLAVKGTANGAPFRTSIFPNGKGRHSMMFPKSLQQAAKVRPGGKVNIEMEPDTGPRQVEAPAALKAALRGAKGAKAAFDKLAYTHRREFADWIASAKRPETQQERVQRTLKMLAAGETLAGLEKARMKKKAAGAN